jgi:hypothetical protein
MPRKDVRDCTDTVRAIEAQAVRARDPYFKPTKRWIVRRLAPEQRKIELADLPKGEDEARLLKAMGGELANIHLGSAGSRDAIRAKLDELGPAWLHKASRSAADRLLADYESFSAG